MAQSKESTFARARFAFFVHADGEPSTADFEAGLEEQLDHIMEELLADNRIRDPFIASEMSTRHVTIEFDVPWTDDLDEANKLANNAARSAIHAAGGGTPSWQDSDSVDIEIDDDDRSHYELRSAAVDLCDA